MAYQLLTWVVEARIPQRTFTMVTNADGTITLTPAGTEIKKGTPLAAVTFQRMEYGVMDGMGLGAFLADMQLKLQNKVESLVGEAHTVTLTNTKSYPFNNSQTTIAMTTKRNTKDYKVLCEIVDKSPEGVGDVIISDKQLNGFKIRYTGAATSVTMNLYVIGGM